MSAKTTFLVYLAENAWRVVRLLDESVEERIVPIPEGNSEEAQYEQLSEVLEEWGYAGEDVCLGLPADMIFSAAIETAGLPRKDRATSLLYRLEEQLPLEAERLTADFLDVGAGAALGFAVVTKNVQIILDALAEKHIEITSICPTAMLMLWDVCQKTSGSFDYIAMKEESNIQLFRMEKGQPCAWFPLADEISGLADRLAADTLARPVSDSTPTLLLVGDWPKRAETEIQKKVSLEIRRTEDSPVVARVAEEVLAGKNAGWVNFRRGALAMRNPWQRQAGLVRLGVVLSLGFLVILAGLFYYRSLGYEGVVRENQKQLGALYGNLFPGRRIPVNVKKALTSEFRRLSGTRGSEGGVPEQVCALEMLRKVVASLPPTVRLRIVDMRIGPTGVLIEGQARDHTGAETLAKSLKTNGFEVDSPRTETLAKGGVSFTIDAKYSLQSKAGLAAGATP
ncbi:MAG: hypothetical protein JW849_00195 [Phycisphaerae bacterium]|nr:hypothetical protein [Phycisphaerae bacterium]